MARLSEEFIEFEKENDLFNLKVKDVRIWDYIRISIFNELRIDNSQKRFSVKSMRETPVRTFYRILKQVSRVLFNIEKYLIRESAEVLVLGHPRRQKTEDKYEDIYCDDIIEGVNGNYSTLMLELPFRWSHYKPYTENIRYLDFLEIGIAMTPFVSISRFRKDESKALNRLSKKFSKRFSIDIDIEKIALRAVLRHKFAYQKINSLMNIVKPSVLISVDSYNFVKKIFIQVANERGIPTIELQHGTIGRQHIPYNYPISVDVLSFSRYIFIWGKRWMKNLNLPRKGEIEIVGFPFMDKMKRNHKNNNANFNDKNILVLSQWTIGFDLMDYINKFAQCKPSYNFLFKLHPSEYGVKYKYEELITQSNIQIITNEKNVYELFGMCSTQIGVYSTALVEGLAFNLKTLVVPLSGYEMYTDLFGFSLIRDENDFCIKMDESVEDVNVEEYWAPNSLRKIVLSIDRILKLS